MFDSGQFSGTAEPLDFISPYQPQVYDAVEYQINRLLCSGRFLQGDFSDHSFQLVALPDKHTSLAAASTFRITLADFEFYVELGLDLLQYAATRLQIPDAIDQLSSALKDAVYIACLEAFLGQSFGLSPLQLKPAPLTERLHPVGAEFVVETSDQARSYRFNTYIHADFLPAFANWLQQQSVAERPPSAAVAAAPIPVEFILDEFYLAQNAVTALQPGDVIVTDAEQNQVLVRAGQRLQQKGRLMDNTITLDGYLDEFVQEVNHDGAFKESQPAQQDKAAELNYQQAHDLFQDIPMQMTFHLHQQTMTLAELRALNDGQCVPLPLQQPTHIKISVNGKAFAQGELIQIDDQLGVRIVQFHQ